MSGGGMTRAKENREPKQEASLAMKAGWVDGWWGGVGGGGMDNPLL